MSKPQSGTDVLGIDWSQPIDPSAPVPTESATPISELVIDDAWLSRNFSEFTVDELRALLDKWRAAFDAITVEFEVTRRPLSVPLFWINDRNSGTF